MKKRSRDIYKKTIKFVPAIGWMTVIFILSSRTGDEMNQVLPLFQKWFPFMNDFNWGHFVAYFLLAAALDYGFGRRAERLSMKLLIVALCVLYGVTDEYHQSFVGGRMMDMKDLRNDGIGAAVWVAFASIPAIRNIWRRIAGTNKESPPDQ
ncbi:VanZ family protein [Paenibacillus sp. J5C_2022]|uniref:VanZ family protein n=1 Tax=Paenibacillus sp. J5C2022 TaxID=2977129 RepID=UPI0021CE2681|nr:VanZ family protein [Paenibacillus sp. J5C2022]MCU6708993.1 VanZ family protein [Paenibacillus sp. J5C2022]